jgi:choline dehydrogenase
MAHDVVVVGGGSAGCVMAARLSARGLRVLVLEAGPPAEANPETMRADGYKDAFANDAVIRERYTVPQPHAGGRRMFAGTGRGMGGSGAVNGMVYTRGAKLDFDAWPEGWRWSDNAPAFAELEAALRPHQRPPTAWTEDVLRAAEGAGFRRSADLNDGDLSDVMGYEWMNYEGEARRSSWVALAAPAVAEGRVQLRTGVLVRRLLFDRGAVVGVEIVVGGRPETVPTRRVVVCAGALETPKLLMLSGIGPASHLAAHGVELVADRPQVGENLHDHPNLQVFFRSPRAVDCMYPQVYGFGRALPSLPLPPDQADTCYVAWPARSAMREAMIRMLPALALPYRLRHTGWARGAVRAPVRAAFQLGAVRRQVDRVWAIVCILGKPFSRGTLRLQSRDPAVDAAIDPAYLSDPRDVDTLVAGVKRARAIATDPAMAGWAPRELAPGPFARGDAALAAWIRAQIMTTYHFAGTCRMGADAGAPVDLDGRLRGVDGVWVADASLMPETPVSALNAPTMMIAWRVAERVAAGSSPSRGGRAG